MSIWTDGLTEDRAATRELVMHPMPGDQAECECCGAVVDPQSLVLADDRDESVGYRGEGLVCQRCAGGAR